MDDAEARELALGRAVEQAISDFMANDGTEGVLVDWVVVAHSVVPAEPGERGRTATAYFGSEDQPRYRTLGLLDYGRTSVLKEISDDMDGDLP